MHEVPVLVERLTVHASDTGDRLEAVIFLSSNHRYRLPSLSKVDAATVQAAISAGSQREGFSSEFHRPKSVGPPSLPVVCWLPLDALESAEPVVA